MRAFIVSDHAPTLAAVRDLVLQQGFECAPGQAVPVARADEVAGAGQDDLIVIVLAPDPPRGLTALVNLHAQTSARILVVGPATDTRVVLYALRNGAQDYVDETELKAELHAALLRLRSEANNTSGQTEQGRLIAVLSPTGGSGATTLAANVATVLAREHKSSVLLDLKQATGNLADLFDLRPSHTLADLCQSTGHVDRAMFERCLVKHASGVSVLAPARGYMDVPLVTPEGVRQAVSLARGQFPYVVADLDYNFSDVEAQVLRLADPILMVFRLDFSSLRNTQRALDYLKHLGIERERVRLVVNRYGQPKEVPAKKAEEALGIKIFHYVPDDPKTVNRANNNGVPLVLESPWSRVSRSVSALAHSINGRHKN